MSILKNDADKKPRNLLLLPTLLLGMFLLSSWTVFTGTLLKDIATSLGVSVGTASLLNLVLSIVSLFLGLAMGALSLRFRHKSLLLVGFAFIGVGGLGFYLAPSFVIALVVSVVIGSGTGMVAIMTFSLIGELLPLEKRGMAVGLAVSALMAAWVFIGPLAGFIGGAAGWRIIPVWFTFPLSMICLFLGFFAVPSGLSQERPPPKSVYAKAFKQILSNRSANACLTSTFFVWLFNTVPLYAVTFYRISFLASPQVAGTFGGIAAAGGMFGGVIGGRLVNQYGRKPLAVSAGIAAGATAILFTYVPNIWVSLALWVGSASSVAASGAASASLILEQVPEFRSSMMSLNNTFQALGGIAGVSIGALLLNLYTNNYQMVMTIFGVSGITSALVIFFLAKDICTPKPSSFQPS